MSIINSKRTNNELFLCAQKWGKEKGKKGEDA